MRARSALFTLFGDVVRPSGGVVWLGALTACMAALDISAQATRTALHRMATEGWVEPLRTGRYAAYRLTDRGEERLDAAAARIYRLRAREWDGAWRLLYTPEPVRRSDAVSALRWWGHGRLDAALWVSPHPPHRDVLALPELADALRFTTATDGDGARDATIVARAWDLAAITAAHTRFLAGWPADLDVSDDPTAAFSTRERLVHHWRSFLFLDPGLPRPLEPPGWRGDEAAARFRLLWERHEAAAWAFYDAASADLPDPPGAQPPTRHQTPFSADRRTLRLIGPQPPGAGVAGAGVVGTAAGGSAGASHLPETAPEAS